LKFDVLFKIISELGNILISYLPDLLFNLTIPTPLSLVGGPLSGNGCGSPNHI
jgi:hypothetical protein